MAEKFAPYEPKVQGNARLFKSRAETMGYVFRSGTNVHFVNGRYLTTNPAEIAELEDVCSQGNPCFYDDPEEQEMNPKLVNPMEALRAKIREEERIKLLLEQANDRGETKFSGRLEGVANSTTIRSGMAESGSGMATGSIASGSIKVAASAPAAPIAVK